MSHVNATTFTIVVVLFLVVTGVGFAALRWRRTCLLYTSDAADE